MRCKFGLIVAGMALISLPLAAQENHKAANDDASKVENTSKNTGNNSGNAVPVVHMDSRGTWALPEMPRATPFPAAAATGTEEAPGRLTPKFEVGGGYTYVNFDPGSPFDSFSNHGGDGAFTFNPSRYLGLTAEFSGYNFSRSVNGNTVKGGWETFLFGPRLNIRKFDYFVPFVEFLAGGAHTDAQMTGTSTQTAFALQAGMGVDVVLSKHVAWRFAQIDYLMTNFSGNNIGGNARQDNLRLATGIVLRLGLPAPPPPPKPKEPPTASCSVTPTSVFAGSSDAVAVHVVGTSPDNLPLTYAYTATGGAVEGTGPDARWNPSGVNSGSYTVTAKVDDGKGGTASCTADIRVEEKPHHPPTVSCTANPATIKAGEKSTVRCTASSPDNLDLTYRYSAASGQVSGNGPEAQFDSTGLKPGSYNVKCDVTDSRGDKADGSADIQVTEPPPPPEMVRLETRLALHSVYFPTAQPTVAKPTGGLTTSQIDTLNALAVDFKQYLTYKPDAHLRLEGHADIRGSKEYNDKLSQRRVERARSYLVEKGVPADHIDVQAFGFDKNMSSEDVKKLIDEDPDLQPGEKQRLTRNLLTVRLANNRRVDIVLSTTGEQSVRRFPFNAHDALTLLSRAGGQTGKKAPATARTPKKKTP